MAFFFLLCQAVGTEVSRSELLGWFRLRESLKKVVSGGGGGVIFHIAYIVLWDCQFQLRPLKIVTTNFASKIANSNNSLTHTVVLVLSNMYNVLRRIFFPLHNFEIFKINGELVCYERLQRPLKRCGRVDTIFSLVPWFQYCDFAYQLYPIPVRSKCIIFYQPYGCDMIASLPRVTS